MRWQQKKLKRATADQRKSGQTQSESQANAKTEAGEEEDRIKEGSEFQRRIVAGRNVAKRRDFEHLGTASEAGFRKMYSVRLDIDIGKVSCRAGGPCPCTNNCHRQKSFYLRRRQARVCHPIVFSTTEFDIVRRFTRRIDLATAVFVREQKHYAEDRSPRQCHRTPDKVAPSPCTALQQERMSQFGRLVSST